MKDVLYKVNPQDDRILIYISPSLAKKWRVKLKNASPERLADNR